jgi:hydroxymethylpyrimidine pyrophosphatase-like HAD family hydrolase
MLEFAGTPVVMGNAVAPLKARGWHETASSDENGVAQAIERFVLSKSA